MNYLARVSWEDIRSLAEYPFTALYTFTTSL